MKIRIPVTAAALVLLSVAAFAEELPAAQRALAAFKDGRYDEVVELAKSVKERDADYAKVQYVLGESRLLAQEFAAAETAFRAVLEKRPEAVPAMTGLGRALAGQKKDDEAEKQLRLAVEKDAKDPSAHLALGEFLEARDRSKDALASLKKASALTEGKDPLVARAYVDALLRSDDDKEAGKVAAKVAKALPKHPMGHFLVGMVADHRGKDEDAIEAYEKAIALDDTFLDAHKNLAILCTARNRLYSDKERTEKAFAHYARYFELGGKDAELEQVYKTIKDFLSQYGK